MQRATRINIQIDVSSSNSTSTSGPDLPRLVSARPFSCLTTNVGANVETMEWLLLGMGTEVLFVGGDVGDGEGDQVVDTG